MRENFLIIGHKLSLCVRERSDPFGMQHTHTHTHTDRESEPHPGNDIQKSHPLVIIDDGGNCKSLISLAGDQHQFKRFLFFSFSVNENPAPPRRRRHTRNMECEMYFRGAKSPDR